ncbi:hypothetical protein [Metabacillus fastidiosus]|uniref:hypothetical protein n=1 Tax=Metabacillus fastidiosus TaxID=1458 RepID=UPI002DC02C04|nr:hypothetical protein [Metabacillus fastidiosus]MEC2076219.1 hypothetical protein [Metabacillus fastidiosus]
MKKNAISFAIAGSIMSMIFFFTVNYLTSHAYLWFIYPTFALMLWPISVYCVKKGKHKLLSVLCSTVIIIYLIAENIINSPNHPWVLYAIYPLLWWPILTILGEKAKTMEAASLGSLSVIAYYLLLNIIFSAEYLWFIYPTFAVLWWPLSVHHMRKNASFEFSVHASILIIIFFIIVNIISSPNTIWAVYPIFCVLWWPLSMYYFVYKRRMDY